MKLVADTQTSSETNSLFAGSARRKPTSKSSMASLYEFIACQDVPGHPDALARKQIRSHVMRRHCRARQGTLSSSYEDQNSPNSSTREYRDHQILGELSEDQFMPHNVICGPSSFDPFDCLPLRIQPYMIELLSKCKCLQNSVILFSLDLMSPIDTTCSYERLYSIEKYADYNPMRDYFLPMAFKDLALFHAILFSSVCLKTLTVKEVPKAVAHLKECIRLVNQRLQSPSPVVADSTILIVLMVAYTEVRSQPTYCVAY